MKRALLALGLAVVILAGAVVAYAVWFVRRAVVDRTEVRASLRPAQQGAIEIELTAVGTEDEVFVTEISMDRALQDALRLGPPAGFKAAPLPLTEEEKGDQETVAFVANYNREKARFVGRLAVTPGRPALLRFPAGRPAGGAGRIQVQHQKRIGVGGSIGFVTVQVGAPPSP